MSWPPGTLRSRASGTPVRAAAYVPQSPDFSVPSSLCPPANARKSPSLSRKMTILGYPNRSSKAMADTEGGRFVDLDAALTGRVPRRSMKYRFRVIHSYAGTSRLCPVISGGCFIPRRNRIVGATSARIPSWQRNFAASSAT